LAGGLYYFDVSGALVNAAGDYTAVFTTTDTTVTSRALHSLYNVTTRAGYVDVAMSTYTSPINALTTIATYAYQEALAARTRADLLPILADIVAALPALADWTTARAAKLDHLDADISSRAEPADIPVGADPLEEIVPGNYPQGTAGYVLGQIAPGAVKFITPQMTNGDIYIWTGDTYAAARRSVPSFIDTNGNIWPDLVGATVKLHIALETPIQITCTIDNPSGTGKRVSAELTAPQSAAVTDKAKYALKATWVNGDVVTLATGRFRINTNP
jgi:hypothetical protein